MTRNTSAVAVCCAIASSRSAVRSASCRPSSAIIFRGSAELPSDLIRTVINVPIDHTGTVVAPIGLYKTRQTRREALLAAGIGNACFLAPYPAVAGMTATGALQPVAGDGEWAKMPLKNS